MKWIRNILIISLMLGVHLLPAQDYLFLGEYNGNEVRLFWTPKATWPKNLKGFNIKRKSDDNWTKLNSELILPGTEESKPLNNLGLKSQEVTRLENKRKSLIASGRLNAIETDKLIDYLSEENTLRGIVVLLNSDYDIALITGFALIDMNPPKISGNYQYGLFPVYDNVESSNPVATFTWQYGKRPLYNVIMEGTAKPNKKRKTVELFYKIDADSYKQYDNLNGFNIYSKEEGGEYHKINESPIWVSLKNKKVTLYYKDDSVDIDKGYTYAAAPNTIFNTSGTFTELKVSFQTPVVEAAPPVLKAPEYGQNSLKINWTFDRDSETAIAGFYVQLKEKDKNIFNNISPLLEPEERSYLYDELPRPNDGYYHFRVIAIKNDELELWSNRKIYFHKKETKPSSPSDLTAQINGDMVDLKWEQPANNAQHILGYYLYTSNPNNEDLVKEGSVEITTTNYSYKIYRNKAAKYRFAVSAFNENYEESSFSDTISIIVPSQSLPYINVWPVSQENNRVTLNWEYPSDIIDLAGFRLYQNDQLIADEKVLGKETRKWISPELKSGTYIYQLIAVSQSGVESDKSKDRTFKIN